MRASSTNLPIQTTLAASYLSAKKLRNIAIATQPLVTKIAKLEDRAVTFKFSIDSITAQLYNADRKEYTRLKAKLVSLECDLVIVLAKLSHAEIVLEAKVKSLTQGKGKN